MNRILLLISLWLFSTPGLAASAVFPTTANMTLPRVAVDCSAVSKPATIVERYEYFANAWLSMDANDGDTTDNETISGCEAASDCDCINTADGSLDTDTDLTVTTLTNANWIDCFAGTGMIDLEWASFHYANWENCARTFTPPPTCTNGEQSCTDGAIGSWCCLDDLTNNSGEPNKFWSTKWKVKYCHDAGGGLFDCTEQTIGFRDYTTPSDTTFYRRTKTHGPQDNANYSIATWTPAQVVGWGTGTPPDKIEIIRDKWDSEYIYCLENESDCSEWTGQFWAWFHRFEIRIPE